MASFTSTTRSPSAYRAAPRTFVSGAPSCPRCDKSVYAAEQVLGPGGREYHKRCLTCVSCKKSVGPGSFEEHEGDPYCKHCYSKNFGPKGYGHGGVMTGEYHDPILNRSPYSSPARTSSVRNSLSYAESETTGTSVNSRISSWGNGKADAGSPTRTSGRTTIDSPLNVYNRSRMQDLGDDMDEDAEPAPVEEAASQPTSLPKERPSLPPKPQFQPRPSSPLKPSYSNRPESPASSTETASTSLTGSTSMSMHNQQSEERPPSSASQNSNLATYKSNLGLLGSNGPDLCRRCSGTVYHAEKVVAGGHKWHKRCLRCAKCSKALDSHLVEKDNMPYCKRCYDEAWGLKSQGFVLRPGLH